MRKVELLNGVIDGIADEQLLSDALFRRGATAGEAENAPCADHCTKGF